MCCLHISLTWGGKILCKLPAVIGTPMLRRRSHILSYYGKVHLVTRYEVNPGVHIVCFVCFVLPSWAWEASSRLLLCGRERPWEADGKSIVMDQSASWPEPCRVRVRGTMVTFHTTSLIIIVSLPLASCTLIPLSHLEIPDSLCLWLCLVAFVSCAPERAGGRGGGEEGRWPDPFCRGVWWRQPAGWWESKM